jgi:DNA-binding transcriptional MerR regulator/methylmalonyl-CoA mutase cobalamin-binding subunit
MYTIREASKRSGVGVSLIRAWERRYGLVAPTRTAAGYRLYDDDAVARLRRVRRLTESGWSASEASRAVLADEDLATDVGPDAPDDAESGRREELTAAFVEASAAMDMERLGAILDEMFALASYETVVDDILMPALVALGQAWADDRVDVAAEHAATAAVQRRLAAFYEASGAGTEVRVVVGLPPGSRHELGAMAFAVALRRRGVGVLYVGADLPIAGWRMAMSDARRRLAVISVVTDADRPAAEAVAASLRELDATILIATGGHASRQDEPLGDGVAWLPDRIGEAAAAAARLLASAPRAPA